MLITPHVRWVGVEIDNYEDIESNTLNKIRYNSYLIEGDGYYLVDTVPTQYANDFIDHLKDHVAFSQLKACIALHGELDHAGALTHLLKEIPNLPIYCTEEGKISLEKQLNIPLNIQVVNTDDQLKLSQNMSLTFIEAKMLHWPDNMSAYLSGEDILFSSDIFSQYHSDQLLVNKSVNALIESRKFFVNFFTPFNRMMKAYLNQITYGNYAYNVIAPSHGSIWQDPDYILDAYHAWTNHETEKNIPIFFDSNWSATKKLAQAIGEGLADRAKDYKIILMDITECSMESLMFEVGISPGFLVGTPTIHNSYSDKIAQFLCRFKGLRFNTKTFGVFGCYGWTGEGTLQLTQELKEIGMALFKEPLSIQWQPNQEELLRAFKYGQEFYDTISK